MSTFLLVSSIFIPLIGSITTFIWGRKNKDTVSIVSAIFSASTLSVIIALYALFSKGQILRAGIDIGFPFQLALRADSLGLFLSLITTIVWFMASIYSIEYIHERKGVFACFLLLSLYGMLGITLAENFFTLLIFFEVFSIASAILVIHDLSEKAVRAGYQYVFISVVGTAALIVGVVILFAKTGSLDLVGPGLAGLTSKSFGVLAFWLIITGFAVKAGLFPVHIWLPEAHPIAPSPASALLSGVMIKAGAYGIIRVVYGVYGSNIATGFSTNKILLILAIISMIGGSLAAITQTEIKKMLAYSSIAQMGYIVLGAALLSPIALTGAILHIFNHAIMKSTLFLSAGSIIHKTGLRQMEDLKGIGKRMPYTMTAFTLAALSMIGIPPFLGFFSKWLLAVGAMQASARGVIPLWAAYSIAGSLVLSGLLNLIYYAPILIKGWFATPEAAIAGASSHGTGHEHKEEPIKLSEPTWLMVAPTLTLGIATLALGIMVKWPLKLVATIVKSYYKG